VLQSPVALEVSRSVPDGRAGSAQTWWRHGRTAGGRDRLSL